MSEILERLRKEYPRIYPYEEDAVRFQHAEYYYAALEALCRDLQEEIRDSREYQMLNKTEDFFIFFGRWRGEESVSYYCPVLAENADGGREALYQIKRQNGSEVRICEELAESLPDRGMVGMGLRSGLEKGPVYTGRI